jgi:hypothetical protein
MHPFTPEMQECVGSKDRRPGRGYARGPEPTKRLTLLAGALLFALVSCVTGTEEGQLMTFAGEWCTLQGLGSGSMPLNNIPYVGMVAFQEGSGVLGSGSVSRPRDEEIIPMRYAGTIQGMTATIQATVLEPGAAQGPQFVMELTLDGVRDLVGTMRGDPDFTGPLHLVRLGPRCFSQ